MRFAYQMLAATAVIQVLGGSLAAQAPDRTPQAAVEDLQADGLVSRASLFLFDGCPQNDPVGQAIFSAVRDVEVHGYGSVQLVQVLMQGTYPACGYEPLNRWVAEVVNRWHTGGEWDELEYFARLLPDLGIAIEPDLQEALLRAAEDQAAGPTWTRAVLADAALQFRPEDRQVREAVAAFARTIPDQTKTSWTYYLGRTFGAEFFQAFAQVAPTYTDDQLFPIVSAISTDVRNGRVPPDAAGLAQLRAEIRRRPDLPPWAQIETEAVIVPHSHDVPPGR